ncbi:MAG: NAD(P)-dependent oxidoreductase [Vulcanimicrobiota bacterium]
MRILLADKLDSQAIEGFKALPGAQVENRPELSDADLPAHLGGVDILVVRSTKVTAQALGSADRLGLIIRAGAGVNTIDVKTASERGIYVANCPGKNAVAVAELALGLMLALDRHLACGVAELRAGRWNKKRFSKARGIKGSTVGVIGTGSIGQAVIDRLKGFEVNILAWSRSLTAERATEMGVEAVTDLLELARRCDIVTIHVALTPDTRGMLGENFFEHLNPGDYFINTSRAEVVDSQALLAALERGVRAGLDVFDNEPGGGPVDFDDPIARHANCYGSHHVGASTTESETATGAEAVRVAAAFVAGDTVPNCVNLRATPPDCHAVVVRHQDRVGVLAGIFKALKEAGLNVQEMENKVFEGAKAASARILLDNPPSEAVLGRLAQCDGVLHVSGSAPSPAGV